MQFFDLIIVIPVGPACDPAFLKDTIESIQAYTTCRYQLIIADDSQKNTGASMKAIFPDLDVIVTLKNLGKVAGLYSNLSRAYAFALEHYLFKVLLKMDDDALMIGPEPEQRALQLFAARPQIGMAGRHITGQLSIDCYGNMHDNYWPRKQLIKDTCTWKLIRRPIPNLLLRSYFFKALRNGYELGENIQGGAYFFSYQCLKTLQDAGLLPSANLGRVNLGEDLLFSLLVRAIGMELGDLSAHGEPIGCAWKGLPATPLQLHQDGRKIIHSIRFHGDLKEPDIRAYFQKVRTKGSRELLADRYDPAATPTTHLLHLLCRFDERAN